MKAQKGFTLGELLAALILIGVVAALTLPEILYTAANNNSVFKVKNMANQLQLAAQTYQQNSPDTPPANATAIADLTKFTITLNSAQNPTIVTGGNCSASAPCYRFPDGGVLQPTDWCPTLGGNCTSGVAINPAWTAATATFTYDPDGGGAATPSVLRINYDTGRVASRDAYDGTTGNDPSYISSWTQL